MKKIYTKPLNEHCELNIESFIMAGSNYLENDTDEDAGVKEYTQDANTDIWGRVIPEKHN